MSYALVEELFARGFIITEEMRMTASAVDRARYLGSVYLSDGNGSYSAHQRVDPNASETLTRALAQVDSEYVVELDGSRPRRYAWRPSHAVRAIEYMGPRRGDQVLVSNITDAYVLALLCGMVGPQGLVTVVAGKDFGLTQELVRAKGDFPWLNVLRYEERPSQTPNLVMASLDRDQSSLESVARLGPSGVLEVVRAGVRIWFGWLGEDCLIPFYLSGIEVVRDESEAGLRINPEPTDLRNGGQECDRFSSLPGFARAPFGVKLGFILYLWLTNSNARTPLTSDRCDGDFPYPLPILLGEGGSSAGLLSDGRIWGASNMEEEFHRAWSQWTELRFPSIGDFRLLRLDATSQGRVWVLPNHPEAVFGVDWVWVLATQNVLGGEQLNELTQ